MAVAKGPDAFRTISEAAVELGVPQHVLRFWETKFSFIRPPARFIGRIKENGAKCLLAAAQGGTPTDVLPDLRENDVAETTSGALSDTARRRLTVVLDDLETIKARIDALLLRS